ncbi:hypothetical protein GGX14DRAFT_556052 [Mycena pura]|uniref:C2H2-type domain-containing protein n=1 Tax=Mycena pura TaxID=153505 RepID=A0AAD7E479_9AGAR|nr:hypothetical protein GGX14DRAFT_556052 [Mycena pura]
MLTHTLPLPHAHAHWHAPSRLHLLNPPTRARPPSLFHVPRPALRPCPLHAPAACTLSSARPAPAALPAPRRTVPLPAHRPRCIPGPPYALPCAYCVHHTSRAACTRRPRDPAAPTEALRTPSPPRKCQCPRPRPNSPRARRPSHERQRPPTQLRTSRRVSASAAPAASARTCTRRPPPSFSTRISAMPAMLATVTPAMRMRQPPAHARQRHARRCQPTPPARPHARRTRRHAHHASVGANTHAHARRHFRRTSRHSRRAPAATAAAPGAAPVAPGATPSAPAPRPPPRKRLRPCSGPPPFPPHQPPALTRTAAATASRPHPAHHCPRAHQPPHQPRPAPRQRSRPRSRLRPPRRRHFCSISRSRSPLRPPRQRRARRHASARALRPPRRRHSCSISRAAAIPAALGARARRYARRASAAPTAKRAPAPAPAPPPLLPPPACAPARAPAPATVTLATCMPASASRPLPFPAHQRPRPRTSSHTRRTRARRHARRARARHPSAVAATPTATPSPAATPAAPAPAVTPATPALRPPPRIRERRRPRCLPLPHEVHQRGDPSSSASRDDPVFDLAGLHPQPSALGTDVIGHARQHRSLPLPDRSPDWVHQRGESSFSLDFQLSHLPPQPSPLGTDVIGHAQRQYEHGSLSLPDPSWVHQRGESSSSLDFQISHLARSYSLSSVSTSGGGLADAPGDQPGTLPQGTSSKEKQDAKKFRAVGSPAGHRAAKNRRKDQTMPGVFVCEVCGADFTAKHNLRNHMNSHESVKEFRCDTQMPNNHISSRLFLTDSRVPWRLVKRLCRLFNVAPRMFSRQRLYLSA